ncbi:hypothetical protein D3C86_1561930 [compost metagenome]
MTVATVGLMYIERAVFGLASVKGALIYPAAYLGSVLGIIVLDRLGNVNTLPIWILAPIALAGSLVSGLLAYWLIGQMKSGSKEVPIVRKAGV